MSSTYINIMKQTELFPTFNFCQDIHVCKICYNTADKKYLKQCFKQFYLGVDGA
jgi:hypothetical protein